MKILGIETSCDETAAAIIEASPKDTKVSVLANVVSSSLALHVKTGGIIPEVAARQQILYILPVIRKALREAKVDFKEINSLAVTVGPGLIGSLLVGVETAKTLSYCWGKPLVPVNHLIGHIYANFVDENPKLNATHYSLNAGIEFPAVVLIASGGHTDLLLMKGHGMFNWLGGTRDDAAGEAFDKIGRLLGLPYPSGPVIEKKAKKGNPKAFNFPRPMFDSKDLDFSFSGLKTAVRNQILREKEIKILGEKEVSDLSAGVQQAIIDVLVAKTLKAAKQFKAKSILLSGGVSANRKLREQFELEIRNLKLEIPFFAPEKWLCTDNAVMIAACSLFNYAPKPIEKIVADPQLYFDSSL